jgi:DHA1 family bicyclomycin/chloramphenicol resistance-like MFS transporter
VKQKLIKYLLFVYLASQVGYYIFAPLYAIFARNFGLTPKSISFIWGFYSLSAAIFILIFGKIENRMMKGKMIVFGYITLAIASISLLFVHNPKSLIIVLLISALGTGIAMPAYKTMYAKNEKRGMESQQWSWLDAGNMFAGALGAGIGGLIVGAYGFRGLFITMAIIQLSAAIVAYRILYKYT